MWRLTVPDDVLETLRCSLCKEYLSQLPIYSYPDQEGVGCGRCPVLTDQNPVRDVSYEAVAKFLLFPCRYKPYGCLENILPTHMQDHEESCGYKQYFCPFIPLASCPWQGPSTELFAHYEEQHKVLALSSSSFEIDLVNMYEDNYLLSRNEDLFVVHLKCEAKEGVLWCSVRYTGDRKRARELLYQIELQKHNALDKITLEKKPVDFDSSMSLNKEVAVHVDTEEIRRALGDPCSIICNIKILNEVTQNGSGPPCKTSLESVDEDILRELECPVCNEYMVPPIHQCVAGHSICSTCKPQVSECPTCRDRIQDTRNFSLEKMTRLIKYCCKYRDFDCPFVSTSEKIKNHESECKFGPYECPLSGYRSCKWKGKPADIMEHARREHDDNVLEVEIVSWPYDDDLAMEGEDDDDCFVLKAFGEVFRLSFKFKTDSFYWAMQLVGPAEDALKYQFELDILDNSKSQQRFFLRRDCGPYTKYNDAFNQGNAFVQVPFDLLSPMMNGGDLMYKCHVVQKC